MEQLALRSTAARSSGRSRRFARFWRSVASSMDELYRPAKEEIFAHLAARPAGPVLEIGPGTGTNFRYYPARSRVIAYEPNPSFAADLHEAARDRELELDIRIADLFSEPLPDESVETVVSTLVLCSVEDVSRTLEEIRRVLRPGGRLLFLEHVAAPAGSVRAVAQRVVRRPWRVVGDGCDPYNTVLRDLRGSRLEIAEDHLGRFGPRLDPTTPTYWGVAVKTVP